MELDYFYILTQGEGFLNELADFFKFQIQRIFNFHNIITRKSKIKQYYRNNKIIKIQFGTGDKKLKSFLNTDIFGKIPIDITKKLPFKDGSVDFIYSCHVIEHIYNRQFKKYLRESFRILKKGGIQIILTPSLKKIIDALYYNDELKKILIESHQKMPAHKKLGISKLTPTTLLNKMMHISYSHKFLYDFEEINHLSKIVGFSKIKSITVSEISDEELRNNLFPKERNKKKAWSIETGIYLLIK